MPWKFVVDDCSGDQTREVLARYSGRLETVLLSRNVGQCTARNVGLTKAAGYYVKFLDSDDVLEKGVLAEEVALADQKGADLVVSSWGTVSLDDNGRVSAGTEKLWPAPNMTPLPDSVLWGCAAPTAAVLYRKSYIAGLEWDPQISKLDDWDWFCRAALRMGKIVTLDHVSYWLREHAGPRLTSSSSLLENAISHHRILHKIEGILRQSDALTPARSRRLAQYFYKELRVLCLYDRPAFEEAVTHILALDPGFYPVEEERDRYMRAAARVIGFRRAILLHSSIKKRIFVK
jgi:glycosyltransferase involved in cell wall biosynthesis